MSNIYLTKRPALDLDLIRTFLTVLSESGFKTAAVQLNKTPAAISMQIKRLEEQLGQRVLERSNKGIAQPKNYLFATESFTSFDTCTYPGACGDCE